MNTIEDINTKRPSLNDIYVLLVVILVADLDPGMVVACHNVAVVRLVVAYHNVLDLHKPVEVLRQVVHTLDLPPGGPGGLVWSVEAAVGYQVVPGGRTGA